MQYVLMPAFVVTVTATAQTIQELVEAASGSDWVKPGHLNEVHFQVQTNGVRITLDGNTPTAANGIEYTIGAEVRQIAGDLDKIKWIRNGGSDAQMVIFAGRSDNS